MTGASDDKGGVCLQCGTCCVGPDISSLGKSIGVACCFLDSGMLCSIYADRPDVCRRYMPDEICRLVAAPSLEERVERYLCLFGLVDDPEGTSHKPNIDMPAVDSGEVQR